jgi:hypothetical protein
VNTTLLARLWIERSDVRRIRDTAFSHGDLTYHLMRG